ncbi:PilW family protein [Psychrobacter proteolyticus]|uniref:PilW family protein n=1 Tax=Psychrobacter proteolyticus TaxID=147825 RepID=UPI003CFD3639
MNPQRQNFSHLTISDSNIPTLRVLTFNRVKGFTLVELMISLVLGLLVSAAALQIFYTSSVNSRRQEASSQIQDNAIFGFSQVQRHLRRANYGAKSIGAYDEFFMNHLTPQGGVVLTAPSGTGTPVSWLQGNLSGLVLNGQAVSAALLSSNASGNSISNIDGITNSDQLTIQYRSDRTGTFDCEGTAIPEGFYVIERYFVRMDTTVTPNAPGLACASAIYDYDESVAGSPAGIDIKEYKVPAVPAVTTTTPVVAAIPASTKANNLAGTGTIIIPNVDYFRAKLGISSSRDFATDPQNLDIAYIPIPTTTNLTTALSARRIVSLQIGILARSDNPTATPQTNSELAFTVLDKSNVKLNSAAVNGPTYLRNVYEATVLLRNARGGL